MELSELVVFNRLTLAFCDFSGIVYKIGLNDPRPNYVNGAGEDEPGIAVPRGLPFAENLWSQNIDFQHV